MVWSLFQNCSSNVGADGVAHQYEFGVRSVVLSKCIQAVYFMLDLILKRVQCLISIVLFVIVDRVALMGDYKLGQWHCQNVVPALVPTSNNLKR